jgi:hypothetical protein
MTAKKRRRKHVTEAKTQKYYDFQTPTRTVHILAESLEKAKAKFQERFGYWPEQEQVNVFPHHPQAGIMDQEADRFSGKVDKFLAEQILGIDSVSEAEVRSEAASDAASSA